MRGNRLRPIAVTTAERAAQLPDIPTLAELGVKDFAATTPIVLMAPSRTPSAIVERLNDAVADALADPTVKDKLSGLGAETQAVAPDALAEFMRAEDAAIEELTGSGLLKSE